MPFIDNEESIGQFSGIVSQISEYDTRFMSTLNNRESTDIGKGLLAQAISSQGIACSAGDTFEQMCAKISKIRSTIKTLDIVIHNAVSVSSDTLADKVIDLSAYCTELSKYNVYFITTYTGTAGNAKLANISCSQLTETTVKVVCNYSYSCTAYLTGYFLLIRK